MADRGNTDIGADDQDAIRNAVSKLENRDDPAFDEMLWLATLAKLKRIDELQDIFNAHDDKEAIQAKIDQAIHLAMGDGYNLTGHGIARNLAARYSDDALARIFAKVASLCDGLERSLGVQAFVTSGTLLGLIRDNRVIPHDDDFDLAYVSAFSNQEDILRERFEIFTYLKSRENITIKKNGGHFGISYQESGLYAYLDLFTGWIANGFFNEDPLDPNTIRADDVAPVRKMEFYGVDVNVPQNPTALLEVNYGPNWRYPDPSFRFDFRKNGVFYAFLNAKEETERYEQQ